MDWQLFCHFWFSPFFDQAEIIKVATKVGDIDFETLVLLSDEHGKNLRMAYKKDFHSCLFVCFFFLIYVFIHLCF